MTELLTMESTEAAGSVVWHVRGEIDLASAPEFERAVGAAIDGHHSVIVDLDKVRYLDSAGLASLVRLHLLLARQGARLKLVMGPDAVAHGTLTLAALDQVIALFASLEDALAG